ncbi:hypothetical protein M5D96_007795 [Drosophila gunungcola]|uniref:Uncharacterized protein n=1 Tax=Drosophila gunungcola TaxID=103775 RepID=A0A9Q0BPG4_9MUSC|nr:hypothetical protein M5D96_007795 [Drosophila gunungcola]
MHISVSDSHRRQLPVSALAVGLILSPGGLRLDWARLQKRPDLDWTASKDKAADLFSAGSYATTYADGGEVCR